jgi:hypothetical protein
MLPSREGHYGHLVMLLAIPVSPRVRTHLSVVNDMPTMEEATAEVEISPRNWNHRGFGFSLQHHPQTKPTLWGNAAGFPTSQPYNPELVADNSWGGSLISGRLWEGLVDELSPFLHLWLHIYVSEQLAVFSIETAAGLAPPLTCSPSFPASLPLSSHSF